MSWILLHSRYFILAIVLSLHQCWCRNIYFVRIFHAKMLLTHLLPHNHVTMIIFFLTVPYNHSMLRVFPFFFIDELHVGQPFALRTANFTVTPLVIWMLNTETCFSINKRGTKVLLLIFLNAVARISLGYSRTLLSEAISSNQQLDFDFTFKLINTYSVVRKETHEKTIKLFAASWFVYVCSALSLVAVFFRFDVVIIFLTACKEYSKPNQSQTLLTW